MNILINNNDNDSDDDEPYNQIRRVESGMRALTNNISDIQEDVIEVVMLLRVIILFIVMLGVLAGIYVSTSNKF